MWSYQLSIFLAIFSIFFQIIIRRRCPTVCYHCWQFEIRTKHVFLFGTKCQNKPFLPSSHGVCGQGFCLAPVERVFFVVKKGSFPAVSVVHVLESTFSNDRFSSSLFVPAVSKIGERKSLSLYCASKYDTKNRKIKFSFPHCLWL